MRIIVLIMIVLTCLTAVRLISLPLCMADDTSFQKAYSLYYQGKMKAAIEILEDYVKEHPDPRALYLLGYAYYKIKKMDMALKYFNEVYLISPDFTPLERR